MINANFIKTLTPADAWEYFVSFEVDLFLSCFNKVGITDVRTMCKIHASDLTTELIISTSQIDNIACLLEKHINKFIDKNGGYKLYTREEIEEIDKKEDEEFFSLISEYKRKEWIKLKKIKRKGK